MTAASHAKAAPPAQPADAQAPVKSRMSALMLAALGVVFGDIGTSPLYAIQESFAHGLTPEPAHVMGVVSLIFWGLTFVVSLKYAFLIMRAGNRGEGGVLALSSLALGGLKRRTNGNGASVFVVLVGLAGASLFFGDSLITPAISVLSAVEGLKVVSPQMEQFILPLTCTILFLLFAFQKAGTQKVGHFFGPVMVVWFAALALLGARAIWANPAILEALNPVYAVTLVVTHGWLSFIILGAVLLAFTGAEALYADMGHFGLSPIRRVWFALVMPSLVINYFGQGALILGDPSAATRHPFFLLVPDDTMLAMVALATGATVIASQAVISGTFSIVQQAIQLDYLPRLTLRHTSEKEAGQIYIPQINWILCAGVLLLVILFRSSSALASAYGFAVVGAMLIDSILVAVVMRSVWRWSLPAMLLVVVPFLAFDALLLATTALKIPQGGWFPILVGGVIFTLFLTWREGREIVRSHRGRKGRRLEAFIATITEDRPLRVPGTAVYLSGLRTIMPPALVSNLHHNRVLHERVVILSIQTADVPRVGVAERAELRDLGQGVFQATLHYGFMEQPDVVREMTFLKNREGWKTGTISYFIGHDTYVEGLHPLRPRWREKLFLWLSNHAVDAFAYFRIPPDRVIELGVQVEV